MRVRGKQKERGGGLRKKRQRGKGQEAVGGGNRAEEEDEEEREARMRPNAGRHKCFSDIVKQASSHPPYKHGSLHCIYRDWNVCVCVGLYAGALKALLLII